MTRASAHATAWAKLEQKGEIAMDPSFPGPPPHESSQVLLILINTCSREIPASS